MWYFNDKPFIEPAPQDTGFVYIITELDTGKKYVGKKLFWKKITRKIKGKKKRISVPSDWQSYYGSSNSLNANIAVKSKANYKREILHICSTRGEMSYIEMKEQFDRNVLFSDDYYNQFIGAKINSSSVKHLKEKYND